MQHAGPIIPSRLEYTFLLEMASISFISTYIAMRVRSISLLTLCGLPALRLGVIFKETATAHFELTMSRLTCSTFSQALPPLLAASYILGT
jgi:hypothetical protein